MYTIVCLHCRKRVLKNNKLKHYEQRYCSSEECQRSRKLSFERKKYKTDPEYRKKKLSGNRDRKILEKEEKGAQCFSDYQRDYRKKHPQYELRNKEGQKDRNATNSIKNHNKKKIVNPDTLMLEQVDKEKVYAMYQVEHKKIVNPDTLMAQRIDTQFIIKNKPLFVRLL